MTEDEAKTKWCPMSRTVRGMNVGMVVSNFNRVWDEKGGPEILPATNCIGSGCMMWRWETKLESLNLPQYESGYCGLAK